MKRGRWTVLIMTLSIVLLSAVGLSLYGYQLRSHAKFKLQQITAEAAQQEAMQQITSDNALIKNIAIQAKGVYVENLSSHEALYEKNTDAILPLASLTKIMTAYVALEHLEPSTSIIFSKDAVAQVGDQGFAEGEQWELQKLIPFMLTTSSNDAAYAIAEKIQEATQISCVTLMNQTARDLGVVSLSFSNPTGLDSIDSSGIIQTNGKGNAVDIAQLLYHATQKYPDIFTGSSVPTVKLGTHDGINTNALTESIPGFIVSKTGYTDTANGNLAFIVEIGPNQPYIVVLLGSTYNGRFADAKKIIDSLYSIVAQKGSNV